MANQYSESFKAVVEAKYNMPIAEVLRRFQCQGVSLKEAAQKTGFRESTVKKYALRHNCILANIVSQKSFVQKSMLDYGLFSVNIPNE